MFAREPIAERGLREPGAVISPDGAYRYTLTRVLPLTLDGEPDRWVLWVMLNPSTADATEDDPTIRRVTKFTERWGGAWFVVVNLYALRATDPSELGAADDPVGPANDAWIGQAVDVGPWKVVAAWGANAMAAGRAAEVLAGPLSDVPVWCLGTTSEGAPRHPLYLPAHMPLERWEAGGYTADGFDRLYNGRWGDRADLR